MPALRDKRVLIVEDNLLVGEHVADTISEAGGWPIGPTSSDEEALDLINYDPSPPDVAVLDLRIIGSSARVASRLKELGVPFVFATGNGSDVPDEHRDVAICMKPFTPRDLLEALRTALERGEL